MTSRLRGRPAHTPGPTFLAYTPDGTRTITVGQNNAIRVFRTGSDAEPTTIDSSQDANTAVVATNNFFIAGSEDGTVCKYSLRSNSLDEILTRCSLPVRDLALTPDGDWVAVASDELVVKVVNIEDMTKVLYLRGQNRPVKHVSFDKTGSCLAVSCTDGALYIYSMSTEEPEVVKKVEGVARALETESEASSAAYWHPDGRAFGLATATRDFQMISIDDWEKQRIFKDGHTSDITAAAWSPNGALLVTTSVDRKMTLWDTATQKIIHSFDEIHATVTAMRWHPKDNTLSYTNSEGELYIRTEFLPEPHISYLSKALQPAPFIHDPLSEISGNTRRLQISGSKPTNGNARQSSPDSLNEFLGPAEDGFIDDDDGAGYAEARPSRKRGHDELEQTDTRASKRHAAEHFDPEIHAAFQPGSTPWRGTRRYLCLNLVGFVWTVDQETHHTVTVEFYDRDFQRDFHFTDPWRYDKACLNEHGSLFSCQPTDDEVAHIYYRPHQTWTARSDWKIHLPEGESIESLALSESYIVATTSANYVRVYTLFGIPFRIYRAKSTPTVTCAAWRDYVLTIGNGAVAADGRTQLTYTIENVKRDETCQSEDIVGLGPEGASLSSVFFSDTGDPCIYDTSGVLSVLVHWRTPGQARWVPLLDTTTMERLSSGKKTERYWPVAVAQERFHCIILKGGDRYPYFPRPLLTDFGFAMPISAPPKSSGSKRKSKKSNGDAMLSDDDDDDKDSENEQDANGAPTARSLEQSYILTSTLHSLLEDLTTSTHATPTQRTLLSRLELDIDKSLLQLLALECRDGEERGMKALEVVGLMRDRTGRMLDAAGKVAARYGREVLGGKIREVGERRLVGLDDGEEL